VVFDRFTATVSCHAQKRSGEHKSLDYIQLQRPVWLEITIEERDQTTIMGNIKQTGLKLHKVSAGGLAAMG